MNKKNIIDEGIEDSEVSEEIPQTSNKGISINVGDTLEVASISNGRIVLVIPSKEKESEENSEGSYMVR